MLFACFLVQRAKTLLTGGVSNATSEAPPSLAESATRTKPYLVELQRESVPVRRQGKVASFKTTYSGLINVGSPAQEFRVVFDTGSGHVILPAVECESEACVAHRRYNMAASKTALAINVDGSIVEPGELCDQVTIGFGTGEVTGEFVQEKVCLGAAVASTSGQTDGAATPCVDLRVVTAVEMSDQPFRSFSFDGIVGLGLKSLALEDGFSFFDVLSQSSEQIPQFGFFLTEGEAGERSELAIGGYNEERLLEPLAWTPVVMSDLGYWQVQIKAIRVDGVPLEICSDGTCRGIVDTGTSHVGVPGQQHSNLMDMLTRPAEGMLDCRLAKAPVIEFELPGVNITIDSSTYMRRLPLREGVSVGSDKGVHVSTDISNSEVAVVEAPESESPVVEAGAPPAVASSSEVAVIDEQVEVVKRHCRPKLMPVTMPEPLGPNLFILGEPVLHRYYSVYDVKNMHVGFGLANNRRNTMDPSAMTDEVGELPPEVDILLTQTYTTVSGGLDYEGSSLVQVKSRVTRLKARRVVSSEGISKLEVEAHVAEMTMTRHDLLT